MNSEITPKNSQEKYMVLYSDDRGVRHIVQLPANMVHPPKKFIGISFMSETNVKGKFDVVDTIPVIDTDIFNDLYGKLLTLCDAMIADPTQREAFKSIVKDTASSWHSKNSGYAYKMTKQLTDLKAEVDA